MLLLTSFYSRSSLPKTTQVENWNFNTGLLSRAWVCNSFTLNVNISLNCSTLPHLYGIVQSITLGQLCLPPPCAHVPFQNTPQTALPQADLPGEIYCSRLLSTTSILPHFSSMAAPIAFHGPYIYTSDAPLDYIALGIRKYIYYFIICRTPVTVSPWNITGTQQMFVK